MTVVEGLKRTGRDLTRDKFVHAMESIRSFDVGLGQNFMMSFSPKQHDGLRGSVSWTVLKNGQLVPFEEWKKFKTGK
jgi:hypothetical protein